MTKAVIAFGRMNPPSVGHEKLAKKISNEARKRKAMPHIYLSHSQDKKKNPLNYNDKIKYARKAFGKMVTKSSARSIIEVFKELEKMGHTEVILVAGSDRIVEFNTLLQKYNGKEYNFKKIEIISAGERDPDSEGVEGMSGTKLRDLANTGDFDTFKTGLASKLADGDKKKIYDIIRSVNEDSNKDEDEDEKGDDEYDDISDFPDTELKKTLDTVLPDIIDDEEEDEDEEVDEVRAPLTLQQRMKRKMLMKKLAPKMARKRAMAMKRKAGTKQLELRARKAAIMILRKKVAGPKGAKYATLSPSEKIGIDKRVAKKMGLVGKIAKKLLPVIRKKEIARFANLNKNEEFSNYLNELYSPLEVEENNLAEMSWFLKLKAKLDQMSHPKGYDTMIKSFIEYMKTASKEQSPSSVAHKIAREYNVSPRNLTDYINKLIKNGVLPKELRAEREVFSSKNEDFTNYMFEQHIDLKKKSNIDLNEKAEKSGIPFNIIREVYRRGIESYDTNKQPDTTPQQWAYARVNSYIAGGKTRTTDDADLNLEEGINDPGIFKAVFLAGGPGSGKSFIVGNTGLTSLGLKVVDVDGVFEKALKKAGLETTPKDIFSPKGQEIRGKASTTTKNRESVYLKGRLGLVLDGTGKDYNKITTQAKLLKTLGYETAMIFVNTDLETALGRNKKRPRTLPDDVVTKMWKDVQNNLGKFQNYFGANLLIVDNSEGTDSKSITVAAYKKMSKWIKKPVSNKIAKNWISQEKSRRGINEVFEVYLEEKTIEGLKNKAEKSDISYSILKKVYDRGMGAYKNNHRPGTTPQQWAFARVNSFMSGGKTQKTTDSDLWAKVVNERFEIDYFKWLKEGAASDTRARHGSEKADLKNKHDREMDAARLLDTKKKNMKEEIK